VSGRASTNFKGPAVWPLWLVRGGSCVLLVRGLLFAARGRAPRRDSDLEARALLLGGGGRVLAHGAYVRGGVS
jgi:hypothetical protein